MTTYDIISDLCKQHGIAITALEKELGFGRGYIGKFKTRGAGPTVNVCSATVLEMILPMQCTVTGRWRNCELRLRR